ncbi:hypothetical protein BT67DRAFT_416702 [Trichocladium antarcticum]|uniref:Uncharacterized protein n=1 Tax=Trichocladium antarcticum TaxID=1450529 RepID=A0AAN6UP17_9PEZI|nr:hypothetical protein BT67DRAFT_416702 [Trichocladium antarcticum]
MVDKATPSPESISDGQFQRALKSYPACLAAISDAKGAKPGQKTLASLDEYRYETALKTFGSVESDVAMGLDDVETLVEWKLRHGKFRPTLMKLVLSNDPSFVKDTVQKAVRHYRDKSDVSGALKILTQLKGIGPATASLLLAVHDADVIFFADEAFSWLCSAGPTPTIKYTLKEYTELNGRARALANRLGVKAVDVERVAFVLLRQLGEAGAPRPDKPPTTSPADHTGKRQPAKRAASSHNPDAEIPVRRSKRVRQT